MKISLKVYCHKRVKKKNVQFVLSILLKTKKEKLMVVIMYFVLNVLIIGLANVQINVHFVRLNLIPFCFKIRMEKNP